MIRGQSVGVRTVAKALALALAGCDAHTTSTTGTGAPSKNADFPTLPAGSRYFETGGRRAPLFLRNVTASTVSGFSPLFVNASAAGTTLVRLQLTQGFGYGTLGMTNTGDILPSFADSWDAVLSDAERNGLGVIVVFTLWGDWNDGTPALGWSHFDANPLSVAHGGPAASPADLFTETETQRRWLHWLSALVLRFSAHPNIVAWETFSELDLATGATEENATAFALRAREAVRASDARSRPVFASTSDLPLLGGAPWQRFWSSPATDLISLHTYDSDLDRAVIGRTELAFSVSEKPVFLGESGLDAASPDGTTLTRSGAAPLGLKSAIWAELCTGSASARSLYWEDGYAQYFPESGLALVNARNDLERSAQAWVSDKSYEGLTRVSLSGEPTVLGTAMASATEVLGWVRNDALNAPTWDAPPLPSAQIRVSLPAGAVDGAWSIKLTDPDSGATSKLTANVQSGVLAFELTQLQRAAFIATAGGG